MNAKNTPMTIVRIVEKNAKTSVFWMTAQVVGLVQACTMYDSDA